jgi:hypothetical protein
MAGKSPKVSSKYPLTLREAGSTALATVKSLGGKAITIVKQTTGKLPDLFDVKKAKQQAQKTANEMRGLAGSINDDLKALGHSNPHQSKEDLVMLEEAGEKEEKPEEEPVMLEEVEEPKSKVKAHKRRRTGKLRKGGTTRVTSSAN